MDIRNLKGSIVALITPFNTDGSVNFDKLRELANWHVENGTDAILALGTTGENATMTGEECEAVLRTVIETVAGRVPVIAGTGCNNTASMLEKSLRAEAMGADGLLLHVCVVWCRMAKAYRKPKTPPTSIAKSETPRQENSCLNPTSRKKPSTASLPNTPQTKSAK